MVAIIISVIICSIMIASIIFFPRLRTKRLSLNSYWVVAAIGAGVVFAFNLISFSEAFKGLTATTAINPLKIIILFISMAALSAFLDEVGMFVYLANAVLKNSNSGQKKLFFSLYAVVSVLTVFTSNDIIILTFTPFICYFCKNAKINPIPYLFAEFAAANTWSMLLIIGNPTNIYLATSANISFLEYVSVMALPTILGGIVALGVLYALFRKRLAAPVCNVVNEDVHITDKCLLAVGVFHLALCTLLMIISSYIGIEMWLISAAFAVSLFICALLHGAFKRNKPTALANCLKRLPYELIPFIVSMFIIVLSLEKTGITEDIAGLLAGDGIIYKYGVTSFLVSNLTNNIPMSVLFEAITRNLSGAEQLHAVYASVIASNIGALLSPVGALAGIMWTSILKNHNIKFRFVDFVKYGAVLSLATLLAALLGLQISLFF